MSKFSEAFASTKAAMPFLIFEKGYRPAMGCADAILAIMARKGYTYAPIMVAAAQKLLTRIEPEDLHDMTADEALSIIIYTEDAKRYKK